MNVIIDGGQKSNGKGRRFDFAEAGPNVVQRGMPGATNGAVLVSRAIIPTGGVETVGS